MLIVEHGTRITRRFLSSPLIVTASLWARPWLNRLSRSLFMLTNLKHYEKTLRIVAHSLPQCRRVARVLQDLDTIKTKGEGRNHISKNIQEFEDKLFTYYICYTVFRSVLCCTALRYVTLHIAALRYVALNCAKLCCAALHCTKLCCAMLCCATLCCAKLCYNATR